MIDKHQGTHAASVIEPATALHTNQATTSDVYVTMNLAELEVASSGTLPPLLPLALVLLSLLLLLLLPASSLRGRCLPCNQFTLRVSSTMNPTRHGSTSSTTAYV
jgi:hypothetical protein